LVVDLKRHFDLAIPGAAHLCSQYPELVGKHLPEGWTLAPPASQKGSKIAQTPPTTQENIKSAPELQRNGPRWSPTAKAKEEAEYGQAERRYRAQLRREIGAVR
jgi:hypothetical protein